MLESNLDQSRAAVRRDLASLGRHLRALTHVASDSVSDAVQDGVREVKETVSLEHQVRARPWAAVGIAAALGGLLGHAVTGAVRGNRTNQMARTATPDRAFEAKRNEKLVRSLLETGALELGSLAVSRLVARMKDAFQPQQPSHMNGYDSDERDFFPPHA